MSQTLIAFSMGDSASPYLTQFSTYRNTRDHCQMLFYVFTNEANEKNIQTLLKHTAVIILKSELMSTLYCHGTPMVQLAVCHSTVTKRPLILSQPIAVMTPYFLHCSIQTSIMLSYSALFINTDPSRVISSLSDQVPVTLCSCDHSVNSHLLRVLSTLRHCNSCVYAYGWGAE